MLICSSAADHGLASISGPPEEDDDVFHRLTPRRHLRATVVDAALERKAFGRRIVLFSG